MSVCWNMFEPSTCKLKWMHTLLDKHIELNVWMSKNTRRSSHRCITFPSYWTRHHFIYLRERKVQWNLLIIVYVNKIQNKDTTFDLSPLSILQYIQKQTLQTSPYATLNDSLHYQCKIWIQLFFILRTVLYTRNVKHVNTYKNNCLFNNQQETMA